MAAYQLDERIAVDCYGSGKERVTIWHVDDGDPDTALADVDLPAKGELFPDSTSLRVVRREARRLTRSRCEVRISYGTISYAPSDHDIGDQEEEIEISLREDRTWLSRTHKKVGRGMEGVPILRPQVVYRAVRWQGGLGLSALRTLVGRLNNQMFKGFDTEQLLFEGVYARRVASNKWEVHFSFRSDEYEHRALWVDEEGRDRWGRIYPLGNFSVLDL